MLSLICNHRELRISVMYCNQCWVSLCTVHSEQCINFESTGEMLLFYLQHGLNRQNGFNAVRFLVHLINYFRSANATNPRHLCLYVIHFRMQGYLQNLFIIKKIRQKINLEMRSWRFSVPNMQWALNVPVRLFSLVFSVLFHSL